MPQHSNQQVHDEHVTSGKLVLPAPAEPTPAAQAQTFAAWSDPSTSSEVTTAYLPHPPLTRPASPRRVGAWYKDPAYVVLSFAIALVVVSTLIFAAFGASALFNTNTSAYSQTPTAPLANGTVDAKPNLGTPATGPGTNQSSQPPFVPTPNLNNQPSPNPTDQPGQGAFTVQLVNVPNVVPNNTRIPITVQTSQPGLQVRLQVTYNAAPFFFNSNTHTTDDNGQAVLQWTVRVFAFHNNAVQATVRAVAFDQNGQQVSSQAVVVTIEG